jgi:hypothetical protein
LRSLMTMSYSLLRTMGQTRAHSPQPVRRVDVARPLQDLHLEAPRLSAHLLQVRERQQLDIEMPPHLNQLGRQDAHGAVIGGKGLVELGHHPADGRLALHHVKILGAFTCTPPQPLAQVRHMSRAGKNSEKRWGDNGRQRIDLSAWLFTCHTRAASRRSLR